MNKAQTFGDLIRNLREESGLTLREVAAHLEIDISMLGKIEKNKRKPTKQLIARFSHLFNVSEKELTIEFLSDGVLRHISYDEDFAAEVLHAAEKKMKYLKVLKTAK